MILKDRKFLMLIGACILVGIFEFLAIAGIYLPPVVGIPLFSVIILVIGHEVLLGGIRAFLRFDFTKISLLMLIAVIGAFYLGQYEEAATVIVLYTLAEKLEDLGIAKSRSAFESLFNQMPKKVQIVDGGYVMVSEVRPGQIIAVKPGEMIALDGEIVHGSSSVDESPITGEPIPKDKREGEKVFAGTFNIQGYLEVRVEKSSEDTTLARIQKMTFEATEAKAQTQKFIEKFAKVYTPFIIFLAIGIVVIPVFLLGGDFNLWFLEALTLIVISCPCALVISTPVSVYSAIGAASKMGALVKGGRYLEALADLKVVALDKTRTLTLGKPRVTDVIPYNHQSREELLSCAAGIEQRSEHPLSQSILKEAQRENLPLHAVDAFEGVAGKGVKANCLVCEGGHRCVGKLQFVLEEHTVPQEVVKQVDELQAQGKTAVVVCSHKAVEGVIALADEVRPESRPLIEELRRLGVKSVMLTGDNEATAEVVAEDLGMDGYFAGMLPQDKAKKVKELLEEYGVVAMVGDGINDAPALALASVGISLGKLGSDTAIEAASVVILNDRLTLIPRLIELGKRTLRIIRFNTFGAVAVKFLFIALALMGMSTLGMAIFADVGVTLIVIVNSLRLMR